MQSKTVKTSTGENMRNKMICLLGLVLAGLVPSGCATKLQYFPPTAKEMPKEQLAQIIPDNTTGVTGTAFGRSDFVFTCWVEDMAGNSRKNLLYARIGNIRAFDSDAVVECGDLDNAVFPLYLAPGKYEFGIPWWTSRGGLRAENRIGDKVSLNAKAGRTYVLSGNAFMDGSFVSVFFTFKEKP
jgi:hypothetical protein